MLSSFQSTVIQELLRRELRIEPQAWFNPDTVVAQGAAIEAAALTGQQVATPVVDITPHTLGVGALDGMERFRCFPLIRRNSPLPCSASHV